MVTTYLCLDSLDDVLNICLLFRLSRGFFIPPGGIQATLLLNFRRYTMPRCYSATEADSPKWMHDNVPNPTDDLPPFDQEHAHAFLEVVDGDLPLFRDGSNGKTMEQPLFYQNLPRLPNSPARLKPQPEPQFRICYEKGFSRYKDFPKESLFKDTETPRSLSAAVPPGQFWIRRPGSECSSPGSSFADVALEIADIENQSLNDKSDDIEEIGTRG